MFFKVDILNNFLYLKVRPKKKIDIKNSIKVFTYDLTNKTAFITRQNVIKERDEIGRQCQTQTSRYLSKKSLKSGKVEKSIFMKNFFLIL